MPTKDKPHFHEGHLHEKDVIEQLQRKGYVITDRQGPVEIPLLGGTVLGHLDGKVSFTGRDPWVLEIKAPGKAVFAKVKAEGIEEWVRGHQMYSTQISGAMLAAGTPALVVVKSRDSGEILEQVIDKPFWTLEQFQGRMDRIEDWVEKTGFPKCEHTGWCWDGPYRHIHYADAEPKTPTPITVLKDQAINTLAEKLYDVRLKKKAIDQLESDLKDELKQELEPGVYETERLKVRISEREQTGMDAKQVRADHGDKYDKKTPYKKVDVEPKG